MLFQLESLLISDEGSRILRQVLDESLLMCVCVCLLPSLYVVCVCVCVCLLPSLYVVCVCVCVFIAISLCGGGGVCVCVFIAISLCGGVCVCVFIAISLCGVCVCVCVWCRLVEVLAHRIIEIYDYGKPLSELQTQKIYRIEVYNNTIYIITIYS